MAFGAALAEALATFTACGSEMSVNVQQKSSGDEGAATMRRHSRWCR